MTFGSPQSVADELVALMKATKPTLTDLQSIADQLRAQGANTSGETVVEAFYRCAISHHLRSTRNVSLDVLPRCVNSSHVAVRDVCVMAEAHDHRKVGTAAWNRGWEYLRQSHRSFVDLKISTADGRGSLRRADLYVVADGRIVSFEFKYIGPRGIRNVRACAAQMQLYLREHAVSRFVVYAAGDGGAEIAGVKQLENLLQGCVVGLTGPAVD